MRMKLAPKALEPPARGRREPMEGSLTMAVGIANEPPARRTTFALCRFTPDGPIGNADRRRCNFSVRRTN
jgi:hypothetical protein